MIVRGGRRFMEILKNILCGLCAVIFVLGLCAAANRLLLLAVRPRCGENSFTVVMLDEKLKDPASVISYYLSVYSVSGGLGRMKIMCVDCGLDEETSALLKAVFRYDNHVVFIDKVEFFDFLGKNY